MDAVEPGCHDEGNIEYWICYTCEQVWQDEALIQKTNIKNVVLPAVGGDVVHVEAVEPTCYTMGNIEYWYCENCNKVWSDEALTQLTNHMSVKLGALEHANLVHVEAVEPGCHYEGNVEHWYCTDCDMVCTDEAMTQITTHKSVIIPATGEGLLVHMDAVEPACHYDGNIEYWICYTCEQVWQDEALTQKTNIKNVVVPATGEGEIVHVEAVEPGCYNEGNIEHWYCADCNQVWTDEALTQLTNHMSVKLGTAHTKLVHMDAVDPACHYDGNIEYWVCYDCGGHWTDEFCTEVTNSKNIIVPAVGGEVIHVPAAEPSCKEGNIEYWYCKNCEQVWQNEALTQLTNFKNVIIPATGIHDFGENVMVWEWDIDTKNWPDYQVSATASITCKNCGTVDFVAKVSGPDKRTAGTKPSTNYYYYTAEVTYNGVDYENTVVILEPTCRSTGFISYFGYYVINGKVYQAPEYDEVVAGGKYGNFPIGTAWGANQYAKKLDHDFSGTNPKDPKDPICIHCGLLQSNAATGDAIMISVIIMILAGAAVVVMLTKKRRMA